MNQTEYKIAGICVILAIFSGVTAFIGSRDGGEEQGCSILPSRTDIQLLLRAYDPNLVIDGIIGDKCNAAWQLAEDAQYTKDWIAEYEALPDNF